MNNIFQEGRSQSDNKERLEKAYEEAQKSVAMTIPNLIKRATEIITAPDMDAEQKKELSQIHRHLSVKYNDTIVLGSSREGLYNGYRSDTDNSLQKELPATKAGVQAKALAEKLYGDFREKKAEAEGLKILIASINSFIIGSNADRKASLGVQI